MQRGKISIQLILILINLFASVNCFSQYIDTTRFVFRVDTVAELNNFFQRDLYWRGADGASSIDLGNGRVAWLFSDGFIAKKKSAARSNSNMVRNSMAIQMNYNLDSASLKYYWKNSVSKPEPFFKTPGDHWFWTGSGIMIKDRLLIFLIKEHGVPTGIGFEAYGWNAALVTNPSEEPSKWEIQYIEGPETFGTIAGSAAVLKDKSYVYAFGAVEPTSHEVYLIRWKLEDAYNGNLSEPEWWMHETWAVRQEKSIIPELLFTGGTEYSVHFDSILQKYIQIQSFGFGEGSLGIRMADSIQGPWTNPHIFYTPVYPGVKKPFMYAAKAHPELKGDGLYITYNVNSFDFGELISNEYIYYPKFIRLKIDLRN